jgi:signal transduction histidine kinase
MKMLAMGTKKPEMSFEDDYRSALSEYAMHGGEPALGRGYDLGRKAITGGKNLVELVSLHHQALQGIVQEAKEGKGLGDLLRASADFLAESVSPYEMAHRGFQDAVRALRQFNETLEEQIKRIAYGVHDEAGQLLVVVHLALADVARGLPKPQQRKIGRVEGLLNQVEKQLRRYSHELRPTVLDDLGWIPAIRLLAKAISKRANLSIQIKTTVTGRLSGVVETALYRIVQEALTNVAKHAKASRVSIRARLEGRVLWCSISDDGVGFDVESVRSNSRRRGLGLIGIQERLSAIGGTLSIDSVPGRGTKLLLRLPMENSNDDSRRARG